MISNNKKFIIVLVLLFMLYIGKLIYSTIMGFGDGYYPDYWSRYESFILIDKDPNELHLNTVINFYYLTRNIYYYRSNGEIDTIPIYYDGGKVIRSCVTDVVYNEDFLLVEQKPLDSICIFNEDCRERKYGKRGFHISKYDSAFAASKIYCYWIIVKKLDRIYGPLTKKEYLKLKKQFRLEDELFLEFEKNN